MVENTPLSSLMDSRQFSESVASISTEPTILSVKISYKNASALDRYRLFPCHYSISSTGQQLFTVCEVLSRDDLQVQEGMCGRFCVNTTPLCWGNLSTYMSEHPRGPGISLSPLLGGHRDNCSLGLCFPLSNFKHA